MVLSQLRLDNNIHGMHMDQKEYWQRKEAEIGESIVAKFYCTYLGGDWPVKGPQTGVLYFSRSTLYFQSYYADKSLASLFQLSRQDGITESHAFQLPLENLQCTFDESPQSLLSSLFATPEQSFVVRLTDGERDARYYRFSIDRKKLNRIVDLINRNRSGVQGSSPI